MRHREQVVPDLRPVRNVLEAYRVYRSTEKRRIQALLERSSARLQPFSDPLLLELARHQAFPGKREEHYSEWLGWVLGEIGTAREVASVLDIEARDDLTACTTKAVVMRETPTEEGHEGQAGRLDLLVEFGENLAIAVEVKMIAAEQADTAKQAGYRRSLEKRVGRKCEFVLLAPRAEEEEYSGFRVLTWERLCLNLRRSMEHVRKRRGLLSAALMLGFVGAVEQKILGFHRDGFPGLTGYLESFLESTTGDLG